MTTRRSFAKSIASLLMAPLLKYQPEQIDRHKLLGMFLDDIHYESRRWDLRRPYVVGDYSYASDGRIMARISTSEAEHDDELIQIPPVEKAWSNLFQPDSFKPFRLADIDELQPAERHFGICPMCLNRRVSLGNNYPISTTPASELPDYDPDDNTIRDKSCELCHGKEYTAHCYQQIGESQICFRFAKILAEIPGCEVSCGPVVTNFRTVDIPTPVTLFRSEIGIAGIVMPVVKTRGV